LRAPHRSQVKKPERLRLITHLWFDAMHWMNRSGRKGVGWGRPVAGSPRRPWSQCIERPRKTAEGGDLVGWQAQRTRSPAGGRSSCR